MAKHCRGKTPHYTKILCLTAPLKALNKLKTISARNTPIFFDRGFLDTLCYTTLIGSEIDERMKSYTDKWRYNNNVFIYPLGKKFMKRTLKGNKIGTK
ncbi:hypothetical protein [Stygiobacter electus]|uniref:Uncharacterized protein n=1 Tax=Stygiobacter electus TaxID=3032292 RepID=A0AAE3NYD7_9BACT|nr:hypothetical protein [Stygiobacter electus]MDF1613226.1 hypothetical protein [Stygiobacter electus]